LVRGNATGYAFSTCPRMDQPSNRNRIVRRVNVVNRGGSN
jgi:hypothetical protein